MKKLLIFLLFIIPVDASAQNLVGKRLYLNQYEIVGISNDSGTTNKRSNFLWTEVAGKKYVERYVADHGGSGGGIGNELDPVWTGVASTYRTKTQNDALYYPLSDNPSSFLTSSALSPYLTLAIAASSYQPVGSYLTASALTPYLLSSTATSTYQPIGSYLTGINSSQVTTALGFTPYNSTNPNGYISSYTETDPVYSASSWFGTTNNSGNWNTAFSWGNHAGLYPLLSGGYNNPSWISFLAWSKITGAPSFLTSETDPVFSVSASAGISLTNITNWNTAFGWGNHASAGYLTTSLAASTYSLLSHTHSFASITSKPTTIGGYGITDFNFLGDARWSLTSHNHILDGLSNVTISGKATGDLLKWNGSAWINFVPTYISSYTESDPVWLADKPSYLTIAAASSTYLTNSAAASTYLTINNPTVTGTITFPSPFILGSTSVTSNGTRLNYLNAASGTTGTTSTNLVFSTSPTLVTPNLGTPSTLTLTNATGLPVSTGISGLATGIASWLATSSSANLSTSLTDETGTGVAVFSTSPALTTSVTTGSTTFALLNTTATTINAFGAATTTNIGAASGTLNIGSNSTINGGASANDDLTIQGTSNATRTTSYVNLQPNGGFVGIQNSAPAVPLQIGSVGNSIPNSNIIAKISSSTNGADLEINGNGYARLFFNDYSQGVNTKYYEMLNLSGDLLFSRLNDANNSRTTYLNIKNSGNLLIGTTTDIASSKLTVASTTQGFLIPRMTTTQKNAISSPATGLLIYDTDLKRECAYDGTAWKNNLRIETGTAAPSTTPLAVGDEFVDTTNKKIYFATGTSSTADWTIVN